MITAKNLWFWFGGIWLFCGLPFLMIGLYTGAQQMMISKRLAAEEHLQRGTVLTVKQLKAYQKKREHLHAVSCAEGKGINATPAYWSEGNWLMFGQPMSPI